MIYYYCHSHNLRRRRIKSISRTKIGQKRGGDYENCHCRLFRKCSINYVHCEYFVRFRIELMWFYWHPSLLKSINACYSNWIKYHLHYGNVKCNRSSNAINRCHTIQGAGVAGGKKEPISLAFPSIVWAIYGDNYSTFGQSCMYLIRFDAFNDGPILKMCFINLTSQWKLKREHVIGRW